MHALAKGRKPCQINWWQNKLKIAFLIANIFTIAITHTELTRAREKNRIQRKKEQPKYKINTHTQEFIWTINSGEKNLDKKINPSLFTRNVETYEKKNYMDLWTTDNENNNSFGICRHGKRAMQRTHKWREKCTLNIN